MSVFLAESQIRDRLHYENLIPALREAFIEYSAGRIQQPLRPVIPIPGQEAWFSVMPAVMGNIMGAKLVNVFPGNAHLGLPTHLALVALFSSKTGELLAIMDGRLITEMRTAAASAIATDLLASPDSKVLAILGSGVQARAHWHALRTVRNFQEIHVWSRNQAHALALAKELSAECECRATSAREAVHNADVVVTATHSPEPVLFGYWLKSGAHVNAVGAVGPTRRELDADAVLNACVVVESRVAAASEAGDLLLAGAAIDAELGELLTAREIPKKSWSVYKSVGVAFEDLAAARLVL
jgi:thiomorpholine-carboxylate dehydrogenase